MTHRKLKLAIVVTTLLFIASVPSTGLLDAQSNGLSPEEILTRSQAAYAALSSYSDVTRTVDTVDGKTNRTWRTKIKVSRPNLYRVEWHQETFDPSISAPNSDFLFWSQGDGAYGGSTEKGMGRVSGNALFYMAIQDMAYIPHILLRPAVPSPINPQCCTAAKYVLMLDEKVGNVDCYVLRGAQRDKGGEINTVWIGKSDFLLRQIRTVSSLGTATQTHSDIVMNVPMSPSDFAPSK